MLPTPSQFDILNNYWICHQTKHKELCKSLAASPKLCMTQCIIHKEEVEEEEGGGKIGQKELDIKRNKWTVDGIKGVKINAP